MAEERSGLAEEMSGYGATLLSFADSAQEWEALDQMPIHRAALWVVNKHLTP